MFVFLFESIKIWKIAKDMNTFTRAQTTILIYLQTNLKWEFLKEEFKTGLQ